MKHARVEAAPVSGDPRWRLLRLFREFAGARFREAAVLMLCGAVLEGAGIFLLIPLIAVSLAGAESSFPVQAAASTFDALGITSPAARLATGTGLLIAIVLLRAMVVYRRDRATLSLGLDFTVHLRERYFAALAEAPWRAVARLDREGAGHSLSRDLDRGADFVFAFWQVALAIVLLLVFAALAFVVSPVITGAGLLFGVGLFTALRPARRRIARVAREVSGAEGTLFGQTARFLAGLKPARAHRETESYRRRAITAARRAADTSLRLRLDLSLALVMIQTGLAVLAALLVMAAFLVVEAGPETLIAMLLILIRIFGPFQRLQQALQLMSQSAAAFVMAEERMRSVVESAARMSPDPVRFEESPEIAFHAVTVRADDGQALLHEASARIPRGQVTLLAGLSGAGKTTFCDVAVGLLDPDAGEVRIDDDIATPGRLAGLGKALAYVGQEPFLLERTLRENLLWGACATGEAEIEEAIAAVGATRLVAGLTDGLDAAIGQDGGRFSGGERQRLRLARAVLRRPAFLVLDEATNALDAEAEAQVLAGVRGALPVATVLIVSHRPAVLAHADHVIWLERGRVVEEGAREALCRDAESRTSGWLRLGLP